MARGQNLLGKIYNKPLLITLNDLHPIVDYLSSPERVASLRFEQDTQVIPQLNDYPLQEEYDKAMMAYLGINPETKVGVLNIDGTLVNREGQMNSQCVELTSYQGLKKKFESQIEMGIQSCVMMINSGGGECFGAWSTANYVQKLARQHNIKLTAYVNGTSASAAYVWASVADKVISHPLGQVGSIGVVVQLYNDSKMLDKMGVERSFVYAGGNKIPFDKQGNFTETFVKDLQDSVDKTYAKFVNHVAVNRNLTEQQVINTNASVFDADVALTLGLIDDVMELEDFEILYGLKSPKTGGINSVRLEAPNNFLQSEENMTKNVELNADELQELKTQLATATETKEQLTTSLAELQAEYDITKEQLELMKVELAEIKQAKETLEAEKVKAELDARVAQRTAKLEASLGKDNEQVATLLASTQTLSDEQFDVIAKSLEVKQETQEKQFAEIGGEGQDSVKQLTLEEQLAQTAEKMSKKA